MDGHIHFLMDGCFSVLPGMCAASLGGSAPFWTDGKHGLLPSSRQIPCKTKRREIRSKPRDVVLPSGTVASKLDAATTGIAPTQHFVLASNLGPVTIRFYQSVDFT